MKTENTQNGELGYILDVGTLRELLAFMPDNLRVGTSEDGNIVFYDDECETDVEDEDNYNGETHVIRTFIPLKKFDNVTIADLEPLEQIRMTLPNPTSNDFLVF